MFNIIELPERFEPDAVQHDPDTLASSFLKTEAYRQANSEKASILYLVGNKGAGKSAIISKINKEHSPRAKIIYYKKWFSIIENRVEKAFKETPGAQLHLLYEAEWRSTLWIEIINSLYDEHLKEREWWRPYDTEEFLDLFNYLVDHRLPLEIPLLSKPYYFLRRIKELSLFGVSIVKVDEPPTVSDSSDVLEFDQIIKDIAVIVKDNPFFLLIDELDKDVEWNLNSRASILGLIEAAESIIRDFSTVSKSKHGLLIRVAIRNDMLVAATHGFVNTQILNTKEIDPAWEQDELEELVAQQIRDHWKLPSGGISRRKLLAEILPTDFIKDTQPFTYLSILSHNNPRSLYTLIKSALEKSIEKSVLYSPLSSYPPIIITHEHLRDVLDSYLKDQLKFKIDGSEFLFPGLSELIYEFFKNLGESFFLNKSIETNKMVKEISKYISNKKSLKSHMAKWTTEVFSDTDKALLVLYEINLLGFREESNSVFYPATFKKANMVVVDPVFYATVFENSLQLEKGVPVNKLEFAKNNLILAISNLTNEVGSTSSRIIIDNKSSQSQSEYNPSNIVIVYEVMRLVWSIRQLEKLLIAYGVELDSKLVRDAPSVIAKLKGSMEQLSTCFETSIHNLYVLTILSNTDDGVFSTNKKEFEKDMEKEENSIVYKNCTKAISNWAEMLGQEEHLDLPDKLQKILVSLREVSSQILLDSNVLPN